VTLRLDRDRALAAAEESIALDRTHRWAWATLSEASAARIRVDRGEVATGLGLWNDVLRRLDWCDLRGAGQDRRRARTGRSRCGPDPAPPVWRYDDAVSYIFDGFERLSASAEPD
jgi:hypothetical protein